MSEKYYFKGIKSKYLSDLQTFGYFEQWMFAFRKGLIACMGIWVIKVLGTLWKEAVYEIIS